MQPVAPTIDLDAFIERWSTSGGAERANYMSFLNELCDVLGVTRPDPTKPDDALNSYVFERNVYEPHDDSKNGVRRIDLYRRGCFVLEAKQGVEMRMAEEVYEHAKAKGRSKKLKKGHGTRGTPGWDAFMLRARAQAEDYARLLPASEGRPPFVLVVDVGHVIEIYSEFTRTGGSYLPFPKARQHRIRLEDLRDPEKRKLLRTIWLDPLSLDPSLHAARVTREVAGTLAEISRSMEGAPDASGVPLTPQRVSSFLMRMIFTMFAEDLKLIDNKAFTNKLKALRGSPGLFVEIMSDIWAAMATGGVSRTLILQMRHFNGGLFKDVEVLPISESQLELFIAAAEHNWSQVEPSIFGTLVERALDPVERHKLGAHYTPRAYVELLVNRVVIEPLRDDWRGIQVEVQQILDSADEKDMPAARAKAREEVARFHGYLCSRDILDPACGTGNFLYVAMELMKRLEAEVDSVFYELGGAEPLITVSPEQFHGIEVNPRAARVAELVLWIGYLQIQVRERGTARLAEPILQAFKNIRRSDAVLDYTRTQPRVDQNGQPITRWDGKTFAVDPVTGRKIPNLAAQVQDTIYAQPSQPVWPMCHFIVGNPPFIGASAMREALGGGYVQALRTTYKPGRGVFGVPDSADFVMYWWHKAAEVMRLGGSNGLRRFGFVTTKSIGQTFNRRVIEDYLDTGQMSLVYALPNHPWVDETDGAAVRIAMTVVAYGRHEGVVALCGKDEKGSDLNEYVEQPGRINANLTVGADVTEAVALEAMANLSNPGVKLHGSGFIVPRHTERDPDTGRKETDAADLGLGRILGLEDHIREYRNGRDLAARPRGVMVIDLFGLTEAEARERYPEVYQHVRLTVKPERDANNRASYRNNWWIFGEPRSDFRPALKDLPRYIATVETSKHRFFQFLDASVLPDNKLVVIAHDDAFVLGVLSSRTHMVWALVQGSRLGVGNDSVYVKSRCFETFPFPEVTDTQKEALRQKGQALDDHRKSRLALHPSLTMTSLYNVLEKLRAGDSLTVKEQLVHDQGLVTVLKVLHDELDAEVEAAYRWTGSLTDQEILAQLMALNTQRRYEETQGNVQFLRREYQDPAGKMMQDLNMGIAPLAVRAHSDPNFPEKLSEQAVAVREAIRNAAQPLTAVQVVKLFNKPPASAVNQVLEILVLLGQVRLTRPGDSGVIRYAV